MRELSDRCMELFPMISINETLVQGPGGGADWLQEHLRQGYLPAYGAILRLKTTCLTRASSLRALFAFQTHVYFADGVIQSRLRVSIRLRKSQTQILPKEIACRTLQCE